MKVYVLSGYYDYEGGETIGVYACKFQAERECKRFQEVSNKYHAWIQDYKAAIPRPLEFDEMYIGCDGYEVEEFDLIEVKE